MNKLFLYLLLFFSFTLISCSGTTNQYLSPDYKNQDFDDSVSIFKVDKSDFSESNPDYEFGSLGALESTVFNERLNKILTEATSANVIQNLSFKELSNSTFEVREFNRNGTLLQFLAPKDGSELTNVNEAVHPRFVLLLDGYNFNLSQDMATGISYGSHTPKTVTKAKFETKYLIWDNQTQDAIGWGKVDSEQVINLAQINEEYDKLILETIKEMIPLSPFPPRRS